MGIDKGSKLTVSIDVLIKVMTFLVAISRMMIPFIYRFVDQAEGPTVDSSGNTTLPYDSVDGTTFGSNAMVVAARLLLFCAYLVFESAFFFVCLSKAMEHGSLNLARGKRLLKMISRRASNKECLPLDSPENVRGFAAMWLYSYSKDIRQFQFHVSAYSVLVFVGESRLNGNA